MTCAAIMTAAPAAVREDETVGEAAARLIAGRHTDLPVVDAAGKYIAMFGISDLFRLLLPSVALAGGAVANLRFMDDDPKAIAQRFRRIESRRVGDAADREAAFVYPGTPQVEALRLFCLRHTTVPVVERETGKLLGAISYWDALAALTGGNAKQG